MPSLTKYCGSVVRKRVRSADAIRRSFLTFRTKVFALEVRISGKWGSNQADCRPRGNRPFTYVFEFRTKTPKSSGPERNGRRRAIFRCLHAGPVNRFAPKTPGNLPLSAALGQAESAARIGTGGGSAPGCKRSLGWSLGELASADSRRKSLSLTHPSFRAAPIPAISHNGESCPFRSLAAPCRESRDQGHSCQARCCAPYGPEPSSCELIEYPPRSALRCSGTSARS